MGRVLIMKKQGMSWLMKTGLVLLLTLLASLFMGEGWYTPKTSLAANVTRYIVNNTGTTISANEGATNVVTSGTSATGSTTIAPWRTLFATAAGATSYNMRISAATAGTWYKLMRVYVSSNYATATQISGTPTYRFGARSTNLTDQYQVYLIDFDPAGVAGNGTVITSTAAINSPNTGTYTEVAGSFTAIATPYTVAAGHRLVLEFRYRPNTAAATGRLAFGSTAAGYNSSIVANETAVVTDSTPPTAGTVTVNPNISGYTSAAPTITTIFTDAETALTSCQYTTDGSTWLTGTTGGTAPNRTCTATPTGLSGTRTINMRATSGGGGPVTATAITRTVDASAPTGGVISATAGNTQNTLNWTAASDASGVASYILRFATGATAPANCASGTAVSGSPFSGATLSTTHAALTNGTQYSYRLCATDSFGFSTTGTTASATPTAVGGPVITSCAGCHGYKSPETFADGATRNPSGNGAFQGSHNGHVQTISMNCNACHTAPATETSADYDHANRTLQIASPISGGTYGKASFPVANTFAPSTCNTTTCHGTASPSWGSNTTNAACSKCHGVSGTTPAQYTADNKTAAPGYVSTAPAGTGRDTGGATAAADAQVGAHDTHLRSSNNYSPDVACNNCHKNINTTNTTFTGHMNGAGTVVFFGLATTNHAAPNYAAGSCSATYCHFGKPNNAAYPVGTAVAWNATTYLVGTTADCQKCHASPPAATGIHAGQAWPGSCITCHSHISALGVITNQSLHINGIVEATSHVWPYPGATHDSAAGAASYTACTPCHTNWNAAANTYPFARTQAAVTCKTCHKGATFNTAGQGCADCHGTNANGGRPNGGGAVLTAFPNYSGSHTIHVVGQAMTCNDCHFSGGTGTANHGSSGGILRNNVTFVKLSSPNGKFHATKTTTQATCSSVACHGTAIWGVTKFNCVSCHSVALTRTLGAPGKSLAAASGEFGLAWGHKKSTRGAVTAADCIVCHLEGVGGTTNTSLTYHKNGTIDLRDPDGTGDARITNISNASYSFVRFSTSYAATARTSTGHLSNSVDNVITIKFCLKCHDANGATNTTARSGAGTAAMPFGGVALGANYTATNGAIGTQGLVNVFKQFSSGNSSRHPVRKPNSRAYPYSTRLAAPYNNLGTTRNTNTIAGNTATPRTKANSVVMYCNDCHTLNTTMTTRTITAHGNNTGTLRGTMLVASPTLCFACHTGYNVSSQHGSGSAITTGNSNIGSGILTCHNCHFSSNSASTVRPIRAADVHGFNGLLATGNAWTYGNANGMRPVAFLRNNVAFSATSPRPYTATVAGPGNFNLAGGQSNCGGNGTIGSCGNQNHSNYSPGGSY